MLLPPLASQPVPEGRRMHVAPSRWEKWGKGDRTQRSTCPRGAKRPRSRQPPMTHGLVVSRHALRGFVYRYGRASGEVLVSASFDNSAKVWSTRDWSLLRTLSGHEGKVRERDRNMGEL